MDLKINIDTGELVFSFEDANTESPITVLRSKPSIKFTHQYKDRTAIFTFEISHSQDILRSMGERSFGHRLPYVMVEISDDKDATFLKRTNTLRLQGNFSLQKVVIKGCTKAAYQQICGAITYLNHVVQEKLVEKYNEEIRNAFFNRNSVAAEVFRGMIHEVLGRVSEMEDEISSLKSQLRRIHSTTYID